jgi:beta-N-acetylhexosaminidase
MLMLSNAVYTAWDGTNAAGWSKPVLRFLRDDLGFRGVTITDSLTGTSSSYGVHVSVLASRAYRAGADMIMLTGSEPSTQRTFDYLVGLVAKRSISPATMQVSYDRIVALKARL